MLLQLRMANPQSKKGISGQTSQSFKKKLCCHNKEALLVPNICKCASSSCPYLGYMNYGILIAPVIKLYYILNHFIKWGKSILRYILKYY